jgi:AcrR family transcriptional regulator
LSAVEIALSLGSAAAGVAAGSLAVYFGSKRQSVATADTEDGPSNDKRPTIGRKFQESSSIPRGHLEKSKRDLRTLLLEKELVSAALTRLYEAEIAKEITKDEREILGARYKTELKSLDDRISKIDAFIQIGDLETLRSQLLQLVNQKMEAIEKRIESTKRIAEPIIAEMMNKTPEAKPVSKLGDERARIPDISDLLERPETLQPIVSQANVEQPPTLSIRSGATIANPEQSLGKKSGDKAEELQKELLEALDRLEKLDVES